MESYYGGLGPMLNAVLWVQVVIFAIFVGLRLYTRSQILHSVGADDYLVMIALIIYSAFVTAGTKYGLGRKFADIGNPDAYFLAVELEIYSQVAGLMVIGLGKCAVGIFLLRIVRNKFQKAFIWAFLAGTVFITLFSSIVVVVQCDPVQRTWDRRVPGTCWIDFSEVGLTVGSWFVVADFCFAILPWFVIWEVNRKRKEKITVACGLSLGIFAGICGIVLDELRHKADIFEQAGLIPVMDFCIAALKSDKLLTDELVAEIKSAVAPLENVPEEQKDWQPGTHHQMLDLVHREGIRDELMEERDARVKELDSELISVEYRFCEH
ncbi:hypothetical protein ACKLNR_015236 [Fusarium oxysporum f. sp. zingiberi]